MEVTVLAAAGGVVVVLVAVLILLIRRRIRRRSQRGHPSAAPQRSQWITPPVAQGVSPRGVAGPPKGGHGLIGLEDLPTASRRGILSSWAGWGLAIVVVAVAVVWNAGFLSSLVSGAVVPAFSSDGYTTEAPAGVETGSVAAVAEPEEAVAERIVAEDPESGVRLIAWSGNGQAGVPGRPLGRALAVVVRDSADRPMPGVEVRFAVAGGGGRIEPAGAETSDLGLAAASWWLGSEPDSLRVRVYLADSPDLGVEFEATFQDDEAGPRVAMPGPDAEPEPASEDRAAAPEPTPCSARR